MVKRIVIGLVAMVVLAPMWWSEAEAQTCTQYRTVSGRSTCVAWTTGTVRVEIKFNQDCFFDSGEGTFGVCSATAQADTTDSIAFCVDPANPSLIREVPCDAPLTFFTAVTPAQCEPKHEQDSTGEGGVGHEHHGCTASAELARVGDCNECCTRAGLPPAFVCADVTPVEMDTRVIAFVGGGEGSEFGSCAPDSPSCEIQQHCSINPKKIAFHEVRPYQCNLTCAGEDCNID
jgi:hypothetical protein